MRLFEFLFVGCAGLVVAPLIRDARNTSFCMKMKEAANAKA
jgi:hypothetical protein